MGTRNDSLATLALSNGDPVAQACDQAGRTEVTVRTSNPSVVPAVSAAAIYAAEDGVGSVYDFTNAFLAPRFSGAITDVTIIDTSKQNAAMTIFFFDASPAAGLSADNAPLSVGAAIGTANCVGQVNIAASDYSNTALFSVATKLYPKAIVSQSTSLWAVMKTTGTPTYATVNALKIKLGIQQD